MLVILATTNFIYVSTNPSLVNDMVIGAVTGLIVTIIAVGVISGINVLGTGLTDASVYILFGVGSLINVMFSINIAGFPVGLGFINTLYTIMGTGDSWGIGLFLTSTIAIITLVSGIMIIIGGE